MGLILLVTKLLYDSLLMQEISTSIFCLFFYIIVILCLLFCFIILKKLTQYIILFNFITY